jgi:hypothetical protein
MTVQKIGIPNMANYFKKQVEDEVRITKGQISTQARVTAPKITGNYANNIVVVEKGVEAKAPYSAKLEYVGKQGKPYATLRLAAKEIARRKGYQYKE